VPRKGIAEIRKLCDEGESLAGFLVPSDAAGLRERLR